MILGEYRHAVDVTGHLTLPEQVLSELEGAFVVTRGFEGNLILYPRLQWRDLAGRLVAKPISDQTVRTLRRRLFSGAIELSPDRDGRIVLPAYLREFAGIQGEVVLAGMYDHVELWSVERWLQILESAVEADMTGEQWDDLGL
jgi:MraZ protein